MKKQNHRTAFLLKVGQALSSCQLVEEALKMYISDCFLKIQVLTMGHVPFKFTGADYEDAALEKLIQVFRKLSDNTSLAERLSKFRIERNYLAHKAIARYPRRQSEALANKVEIFARLTKLQGEGDYLWKTIMKEADRIALPELRRQKKKK
jgi:hypothetical protein